MRYRYRRGGWGWRGFPIPLFFLLFFIWGHSIGSFLISIGIMIVLYLLIRGLMASTSQPGITGTPPTQTTNPYQQPYQPYQQYQPYQSPYTQPEQDTSSYDEQLYQPYQQGYQPQQAQKPQAAEKDYEQTAYEQYEQPEAQYPQEELPPMQQ